MSKDILIINQQHTSNLGDKAIGEAMKRCFYEYELDFLPYIPTERDESLENPTIYKKNFFESIMENIKLTTVFNDAIYYFKIRKMLKKQKYKLAIIGGGELLSGNLKFNSALLMWTKILYKKNIPIIVAGVSGNAVSERLGKRYKKALNHCEAVYVRDEFTQKMVEKTYGVKALYCPDFVFFLQSFYVEEKKNIVTAQIYCYDYVENEEGELSKEEYFEKWYLFIKENIKDGDVILSFSDKDDKISTLEFKEYVQKKYKRDFEIENTTDLRKMVDLLKSSKKILSGRMHPMILGLLCENEIIPFITKNKIKEFEKEWTGKGKKDLLQAYMQVKEMTENIKLTYLSTKS